MWLSDISVVRPVFAAVLSMLLFALGILSFRELPIREYPNINPPIVSIRTTYPGASAAVVETRITQTVESQVSGIEGVKTIRSSSRDGRSSISIEFGLERDIDEAANDVRDRVSRVARMLPVDADPPQVSKLDADARPIQYLSLNSPVLEGMQLTDYAARYIVDQLAVIPGVANVSLNGSGRFAMRIWLDRLALGARSLTVNDIEAALRRENLELPAGRIESQDREFTVRMARNYVTAEDFRELVLRRGADGHLIRLGEVAKVEVGPRNLRSEYRANGRNTVGLGIIKQSTANTLEVLEAVAKRIDKINATLPEGMQLITSSDESVFIRSAIDAVYRTLAITTCLVSLVILAFLGSFRAMIIPAITIPICLTAAFTLLAAFGYTVNLVTLLGLVLAIGLVVDDSIVVLENIHRRIEDGEPPLLAAFAGSRQVAFAVVATTAVLVAVFVPIAFLQDNIGRIFAELAIVICAAVIFSSVLALSLTPMLCSKFLRPAAQEGRTTHLLDRFFTSVSNAYERSLKASLKGSWLFLIVVGGVAFAVYALIRVVPQEFAPREDQGTFFTRVQGPEGASFAYMRERMYELERSVVPMVEEGNVQRSLMVVPGWGSSSPNSGVILVTMAPWDERTISTQQAMGKLLEQWSQVPGVRAFPFMRSGISRHGGGQPVQFVLGGSTYEELARWRDLILEHTSEHPGFTRVDSDLRETQPQLIVRIDKNRAADLGVSVLNIGRTLQTMMSERRITTYVDDGEEYDVILQAREDQRATPDDLQNIYVRSDVSGQLIPLSNLTRVDDVAGPGSLNRYNRLRAVTITANLAEGYALGDALAFLEGIVREELPPTAQIDYKGESLEYKEASGGMYFMFALALLVVFLVLAAQFESFVHPLVIMVTVPLAVVGALFGLYVTGNSLNIYSQIGIVMLVGIAAKNGILIVEFINQLRDQCMAFDEAILEAARIRFRPVIMTTLSTIMGSIPLILAQGAGAESRMTLGIVIFSGVSVASILTLYIVPVFYRLLARRTGSPGAVAQELDLLRSQAAD
ncbi:MAG: efflux RND transporter permease subunit [Gammaproteobacteria bacterium]|nr:efflux RND transporter permease subunit [Gammaproteobacteria bacterium]